MKLTLQGAEDGDREARIPIPHNKVFEAEVTKVEERETPFDDKYNPGEKTKQFSFTFKVLDEGEFHDRWVWANCSTWFSDSPTCKLRQWIQAILDVDILPSGFIVETDDLVGQHARIIVHAAPKKSDPTVTVNWVNEVRASRGAPALAPKAVGIPLDEEPFRVDAGEWNPGHWGQYPKRILPQG